MLNYEEMRKRVSENFKKIEAEHFAHNVPIVTGDDEGRVFLRYKDGSVVEVTDKYKNKPPEKEQDKPDSPAK